MINTNDFYICIYITNKLEKKIGLFKYKIINELTFSFIGIDNDYVAIRKYSVDKKWLKNVHFFEKVNKYIVTAKIIDCYEFNVFVKMTHFEINNMTDIAKLMKFVNEYFNKNSNYSVKYLKI